jgi:hypothetical protein
MIGREFLPAIERRAIVLTALVAVAALVWPSAGLLTVAGVLGGAFLTGVSFWAIKRGVNGLSDAVRDGEPARRRVTRAMVILVGRYALLAVIAYVMIARLRLSPVGLLLGASVIPAAVAVEALATLRKNG